MFATSILGFTLSVIWFYIAVAIWIAIAFWPARVAGRKGHSFWGYFVFSLFLFPVALITAYLVSDNKNTPAPAPTATPTE